jgi:hypothetical protein
LSTRSTRCFRWARSIAVGAPAHRAPTTIASYRFAIATASSVRTFLYDEFSSVRRIFSKTLADRDKSELPIILSDHTRK